MEVLVCISLIVGIVGSVLGFLLFVKKYLDKQVNEQQKMTRILFKGLMLVVRVVRGEKVNGDLVKLEQEMSDSLIELIGRGK